MIIRMDMAKDLHFSLQNLQVAKLLPCSEKENTHRFYILVCDIYSFRYFPKTIILYGKYRALFIKI